MTFLALNLKKVLGSRFFKIKCEKSPSFVALELPLFSTINLVYVLEINIFERYYSNLKVVKFIVENRQKIWCNFMHLEKSLMGLQVRVIKWYYIDTSIQKLLKIRKIIFWRNTHIPVEKQSNQDRKYPHPFKKQRTTHKSSFDPLLSYHDFQLMFLSPNAG